MDVKERLLSPTGGLSECWNRFLKSQRKLKEARGEEAHSFWLHSASLRISAHHYIQLFLFFYDTAVNVFTQKLEGSSWKRCYSLQRSQQFAPEEERISPSALLICISSRKMHSRPHREKNWTLFFFFQSGHLNRLGWRGKVTRRILFKRVKTLHTFL